MQRSKSFAASLPKMVSTTMQYLLTCVDKCSSHITPVKQILDLYMHAARNHTKEQTFIYDVILIGL